MPADTHTQPARAGIVAALGARVNALLVEENARLRAALQGILDSGIADTGTYIESYANVIREVLDGKEWRELDG